MHVLSKTPEQLLEEIEGLRSRLEEAEETLRAIHCGEVDALLVDGPEGEQVFTLKGADYGYRVLVETMSEGAMTLRADGMVLYANSRLASMLEIPLETLIGERFIRFIPPAQSQTWEDLLQEGERDRRGEFNIKTTQGTTIPVFVAISHVPIDGLRRAYCAIVTDLTEQKHFEELQKAQESLRVARIRMETTLTAAEIGTWTWDIMANRLVGDKNVARMCSIAELDGAGIPVQRYLQSIHPDDLERLRGLVAESSTRESNEYELDLRLLRPDGSYRWIAARGKLERDETGKAVACSGVVIDISDRKRAEDALHFSQAQFAAIVDLSPMGLYLVDSKLCLYQVNPRARPAFGEIKDLIGRDFGEVMRTLWPAETANEIMGHFRQTLETGKPYYSRDFSELREDRGVREYYDWELHRVSLPDGQSGVACFFIDVSQHALAKEAVQKSERQLRFMAESMPQKIFTATSIGDVNYFNRQWQEFTGLPFDKLRGWGWKACIHPSDLEENLEKWHRSVETGESFQFEHRIRRHDGVYRWHLSRAHAMRDPDGNTLMWIGSNTDIEDQKQTEEKLERMVADRTESLRETTDQLNSFCYSIAHDLRAPLRAQHGFARFLLDDYGAVLGETGRNYAERIATAADKLEKLVNDLLSHASLSRVDLFLEQTDLVPLVTRVCADLAEEIHKKKASVSIEHVAGAVLAHEPSLKLVVSNLLSNAVKYSKPGLAPAIRVWTEARGEMLRLWVEDEGIGIRKEHHEKIFGVFQRLHNDKLYPGTGIGLAIVRKGVERMGGKTGVESELGKGSRFWIDLQRA